MSRTVYYKKEIALKSLILLWTLFSFIILLLSCIILGTILNSLFLGGAAGIMFVILYLYSETRKIHSVEFSEEGVRLEYLKPFSRKNIDIPFSRIICVYFYCGPFGLNTPGLYVKFIQETKFKKIGVSELHASSIEKLFKSLKQKNVKCGVSKDSADYLDLKKLLGTIDV